MDAATWLSAIGTVGAFIVGGVLLLREVRRGHELERGRARRQAEQVAAWAIGQGRGKITLIASNQSDLPVYDVVVVADFAGAVGNYDLGMLAPSERSSLKNVKDLTGLSLLRAAHPVPVSYVDSAGQRWLRDGLGLLYPGTDRNFDRLEFPNGIVGGAERARRRSDWMSRAGRDPE